MTNKSDILITTVLAEAAGQNRTMIVGRSKGWSGNPTLAGIGRMDHPKKPGEKILISPQGRWQHLDRDGEELSNGDSANELIKHLGETSLEEGSQPDFKNRFNTELNPKDETKFRQWVKTSPMYLRRNHSYDYDLRGAWKAGVIKPGKRLPEMFKKPNHPTFSNESKYHSRYLFSGGNWRRLQNGQYEFTPSEHNLKIHGPKELSLYFKKFEPNNLLVLR